MSIWNKHPSLRQSTTQMIATGLVLPGGVSILGVLRSIADYLATWDEQELTGDGAGADNVAVDLGRNVVINGDFATDTIWVKGAGWAIAGGKATKTAGASTNLSQNTITLAIGSAYELTYTISGLTAGGVSTRVGSLGVGATQTTNGTFVETIVAAGTNVFLFAENTQFDGSIEDVILKQTDILASSAGLGLWDGTHSGVAVGQTGQYNVPYLVEDDGAASVTDFLSAEYNSVYDASIDFTKMSLLRKSTWDTTERYLFYDYVDANNYVAIYTSTTQDEVVFEIMAGGTLEQITWDSNGSTDLMLLDVGRETNVMKARVNGVSVGSTAIAGTFVGNFTIMVGGANSLTPTAVNLGQRGYMSNIGSYASDADMVGVTNSMGIPS